MGGLRLIASGGAVAAAADGGLSTGVLRELYEKHAAQVFGRCRWLLRDEHEARDALQEVFVRALRSRAEFRGAASGSTWLLQIATNHCLNVLRARRPRSREKVEAVRQEHETEPPERRELVRMLLSAAPPEAQEVAVLYYVDELTQVEIAQAVGRSLPTVRKRLREFLSAARAALRESLPGLELPEGEEP